MIKILRFFCIWSMHFLGFHVGSLNAVIGLLAGQIKIKTLCISCFAKSLKNCSSWKAAF